MEIRIVGKTIESNSLELGTQGENGVEETRFIIERFTSGAVDLSEGLAYVMFRLPDGTEGYTLIAGEYREVSGDIITLRWIVGSEVTAQPGTIDVAVRISGLESRLWNSKPAYFTIAETLQQETPQPVTVFSRAFSPFSMPAAGVSDAAMLMSVNPDTEPPITVSERTLNIPSELQNPAVQNDKRSEQIRIVLPRFFDGHDLSAHAIYLRTQSSGGVDDIYFSGDAKTIEESEITLFWTLEPPQTSYSGKLSIQLMVVGSDFQWSSASTSVNILKLLDGVPVIPTTPKMLDQFITDISAVRDEAAQSAAEAREAAEAIAQAGLKLLGYYPTLAELQASVTNPAIGDLYGVGINPDIYAYVWTGEQWVQGQRLTPEGGVQSVNGKAPDAEGNIALTANDVGGSRPDILVNSDYRSVVNQKGLLSYVSESGVLQTIDMWRLTAAGTVTINNDGTITISANKNIAVGFVQYIEQTLEGTHTHSIFVTAFSGGIQLYAQDTTNWTRAYEKVITKTGVTDVSGIFQSNYRYRCGLVLGIGASITVRAMKLENGEGQTLARQDTNGNWILNDPPPQRGTELRKCQEQYFIANGNSGFPFIGQGFIMTATAAQIIIPLPVTMRTNVITTGQISFANLYVNDSSHNGTSSLEVTSFSFPTITENAIKVQANFASGGVVGDGATLQIRNANGYFAVDQRL